MQKHVVLARPGGLCVGLSLDASGWAACWQCCVLRNVVPHQIMSLRCFKAHSQGCQKPPNVVSCQNLTQHGSKTSPQMDSNEIESCLKWGFLVVWLCSLICFQRTTTVKVQLKKTNGSHLASWKKLDFEQNVTVTAQQSFFEILCVMGIRWGASMPSHHIWMKLAGFEFSQQWLESGWWETSASHQTESICQVKRDPQWSSRHSIC